MNLHDEPADETAQLELFQQTEYGATIAQPGNDAAWVSGDNAVELTEAR